MLNPVIGIFVALQLADMATTTFGLSIGAREQNALAARVFAELGPTAGVALYKLAAVALILAVLARIEARWSGRRLHWHTLCAANVLYFFVVLANLATIAALL